MLRVFFRVVFCVAMGSVWGCRGGEEGGRSAGQAELLVYCGAGIRPPVAELVEIFGRENGVKIVTDYAGSEVLLSKLKLSRRGDLYMPGDKYYVDQAARESLIVSQKPVCFFVPTILVQKSSPKGIRGLRDLIRPGGEAGAWRCAGVRDRPEVQADFCEEPDRLERRREESVVSIVDGQ